MTTVRVRYHEELDGWWADSPDIEGYVAGGASLGEVRQLVKEGVPFFLEEDSVELLEEGPGETPVVETHVLTTALRAGIAAGALATGRPGTPRTRLGWSAVFSRTSTTDEQGGSRRPLAAGAPATL